MILLVDIGNTRLKWALADRANGLIEGGAIAHAKMDELQQQWQDLVAISQVCLASVAQADVQRKVEVVVRQLWDLPITKIVVEAQACGIQNDYQSIEKLGVDRWLVAIGARTVKRQGDIIIVDAGTAVTIDWLSHDNIYQGGVILPGVMLMHDSLASATFGVGSYVADVNHVVGKTTADCVNAGVYYGLVGAVDRIIKEMQLHIESPTTVLLCGGSTQILSGALEAIVEIDDQLVLKGIYEVVMCDC